MTPDAGSKKYAEIHERLQSGKPTKDDFEELTKLVETMDRVGFFLRTALTGQK
jgi:hypothetical protein